MSIQFSGGPITFTTFLGNTTANLIAGIQAALVASGWHIISGGGTTNLLIQTATTPQGLAMRFRFVDNGLSNSAGKKVIQIGMSTINGDCVGPSTSDSCGQLKVYPEIKYTIICGPYYFWILILGSIFDAQCFVFGGVPYIPDFVKLTNCGYLVSQSSGHNNTFLNGYSLRDTIVTASQNGISDQQIIVQNQLWYTTNSSINDPGSAGYFQFFAPPGSPFNSGRVGPTYSPQMATWNSGYPFGVSSFNTFFGGVFPALDPWVGWGYVDFGQPQYNLDSAPRILGIMWDAFLTYDYSVMWDTTASGFGHNWYAITGLQIPNLFVATS